MPSEVKKNTARVSVAILCSRILGLIRESIFAALFGASTAMDAFNVAFRIPNLLRDLFAEGALSSAFVTTFTSLNTKQSRQEALALASRVITLLAIVVSALIFLSQIYARDLVLLYAGDFEKIPGKVELSTNLVKIMFPFLLLVSISSVFVGILNSVNRFGLPALAPALFNVGTIAGGTALAFWFDHKGWPMIYGMGFGTLIGGLLQWGLLIPLCKQVPYVYKPLSPWNNPHVKKVIKLMIPATIGLSAVQINLLVTTNFASRLAEGSISWLSYAFRLMQLPIGIFGVAIATVSLPALTALVSTNKFGEFKDRLSQSLRFCFFLTLPASTGLWILAEPIVRCLFRWNAFTESDVVATSLALKAYAVGLVSYSLVKVLVPAFYAQNKTRIPVYGTILAIVANILFCWYLSDKFTHQGLALATSLAATLNAGLLFFVGQFASWKLKLGPIFIYFLKISLACAIMGIAIKQFHQFGQELFGIKSQLKNMLLLIGDILTGALLYFGLCFSLKISDITEMLSQLKSKIFASNSR